MLVSGYTGKMAADSHFYVAALVCGSLADVQGLVVAGGGHLVFIATRKDFRK